MPITTVECADCGATVAGWIARGDTDSICFQCNERRLARWVCADQINGLEARIAALEAALRQMQDCIGDALVGCRDPAHRGRD